MDNEGEEMKEDLIAEKDVLIRGLAVQLFLHYEKEHTGPWYKLWPDQKELYIKNAEHIVQKLIDCNQLQEV